MAEIQQKIMSCPKGHYYDANRYSECPICKAGDFAVTQDPYGAGASSFAQPGHFSQTIAPGPEPGAFPATEMPGAASSAFPATEMPGAMNRGFQPTQPPESSRRGFSATQVPNAVNPRSNERMGRTQYVDAGVSANAPVPVVGWLVAVTGPCRGTDWRVHTGYNHIGREAGDIRIAGDDTISAERDASITYVPQTKKFYIAHEQGKNVLLVNDLPVIGGSQELQSYDIITIGTTKLIFLALCGERFSWENEA